LSEAGQRVAAEVDARKQQWLSELCEHPERFSQIERRVHEQFGHLADDLTASLLAEASSSEALQARKKRSRLRRWTGCVGLRLGR
jgi:hypothetical protein